MGKMANAMTSGQQDMHHHMPGMQGGFDEAALGPQGQMGMMGPQGADPAFMEAWGQATGNVEQQAMMGMPGGGQFADDQYQMGGAMMQQGDWAEEFGQPGPMQAQMQQAAWAEQFAQQQHMGPMPWSQEFQQQQIMQGGQMWANEFQQQHPQGWAQEFNQQHAQPGFEEAWQGAAQEEAWAEEFGEEKALPNERDLDEAATRQLTAQVVRSLNNDPKMRQSQFVDFIAKMSTGEIEFQDGVVVHNGGPKALPGAVHPSELEGGDWAAEFATQHLATQADQENVESWAEEYSGQQWATEFQAEQGPQSWAGEFASQQAPPNVWADQFAQQQADAKPAAEEWVDEFTDGDALGLNPNPLTGEASLKHKFTLPNPYSDDETPYDTGMDFYQKGDYGNAVLAFEAELQRNGDNGDAKFQLASAIILSNV